MKLINKLIDSNRARARKDIQSWRTALQQAENTDRPRRTLLYNLYDELVLDDQYIKESQIRRLKLIGSDFTIYHEANMEKDQDKTLLFKQKWFYDLLNHATDTISWGHSLLQVGDLKEGKIDQIKLIKRRHVIPEKGLFLVNQHDEKGILYRQEPKYFNWLIELGDEEDLGLLNKAAPYILYKRFALSAWSEYCEIFAMPLRYGKTNVKDTESLNQMEDMLINMATAAYAVIDNEEELHFLESTKGNGEVYDNLINRCNTAISKIFNSAVIGEDSQGGSRSKEEVGERTTDKVAAADTLYLEMYINAIIIPKLIRYGYPLKGYAFRFEKAKDLNMLWKITSGLLPYKEVDNKWITETFGIPVEDKPTPEAQSKLSTSIDPFG